MTVASPALEAPQPLLTAADVSQLLTVPETSVREYTRRVENPIPHVRIGKHVRFDQASLWQWIQAQEVR